MKCLLRYQWVKLPRDQMPIGKGIMGAWARLASRAAFRNGQARYYKYINPSALGQAVLWGSKASLASRIETRPWT